MSERWYFCYKCGHRIEQDYCNKCGIKKRERDSMPMPVKQIVTTPSSATAGATTIGETRQRIVIACSCTKPDSAWTWWCEDQGQILCTKCAQPPTASRGAIGAAKRHTRAGTRILGEPAIVFELLYYKEDIVNVLDMMVSE